MGRIRAVAVSSCCGGDRKSNEWAFVQLTKCVFLLNAVDSAFGCVNLRCPLKEAEENESDADRLESQQAYCCGEVVWSSSF